MMAERRKRPRSPITQRDPQTVPDLSGFLIIRLLPGVVSKSAESLDAVAEEFKLNRLAALLKRYNMPSRRLITSVSVERLANLEDHARDSDFPPLHSLASYWRLDAREVQKPLEEVLAEFRKLENEIDHAYLERSVSEPATVNAADDPYAASQNYLDAAPTGIDARWAWTQPGGKGCKMHFIDLEQGWFLNHEDLPTPKLIFNSNKDGIVGYRGDHGTAVLGAVAGLDNTRGIVGIAPALASVQVVSHFEARGGTNLHVADAIVAAVNAGPTPHVLLLEVQRDALPTEIDDGDFDAIRLAVAVGIVVIEPAGNSGTDLDNSPDAAGMNPASIDFRDSGAILVAAATSSTPHERLLDSNFGSRVNCYAWGENIVSAGYGDLNLSGVNDTMYTSVFKQTSGAAAIIAGAALLVQALYLKPKARYCRRGRFGGFCPIWQPEHLREQQCRGISALCQTCETSSRIHSGWSQTHTCAMLWVTAE